MHLYPAMSSKTNQKLTPGGNQVLTKISQLCMNFEYACAYDVYGNCAGILDGVQPMQVAA